MKAQTEKTDSTTSDEEVTIQKFVTENDCIENGLNTIILNGVIQNNFIFRIITALTGTTIMIFTFIAMFGYRIYWKLFFQGDALDDDQYLMVQKIENF